MNIIICKKNIVYTCLIILFSTFGLVSTPVFAECIGKVEAGPAFLHVDVLQSGKIIKKINMAAVKADGNVGIWNGICLKPTILYGKQGSTETLSGGSGIGYYAKLTDKVCVTPSLGCNFTEFKTTISMPIPGTDMEMDLKQRFRSVSPYGAVDVTYTFLPGWRVCGIYQYVWSYTHTSVTGMKSTVSHPKGSNYALLLETDINEHWSINLGGAYNTSLTKEKHGLKAYGVRLAAAFWF